MPHIFWGWGSETLKIIGFSCRLDQPLGKKRCIALLWTSRLNTFKLSHLHIIAHCLSENLLDVTCQSLRLSNRISSKHLLKNNHLKLSVLKSFLLTTLYGVIFAPFFFSLSTLWNSLARSRTGPVTYRNCILLLIYTVFQKLFWILPVLDLSADDEGEWGENITVANMSLYTVYHQLKYIDWH